ncbi:N-acetylglutaminylglutamine amidotransferase [Leucobacter denitrificans]|uniref:asparagine synthase (glutamine-hydrolyzing) n=1 Tax=Leucobacter denitrificans TaxID=683042 RepID=A0A7G9S700_9MICO|nr:N-acetylglutaminylglutamine amidotransferase [Leucobacter denitrificans]QNN63625.1 N-acetylglutaminylglutamine amidotransferase [Leucobacter denitrificans]
MCGIVGELLFTPGAPDMRAVERMMASVEHRGPDDGGMWSRQWAAFGHHRLAIIDLSERGSQPMTDENLGLTVVFNGCIYNHHELREELRDEFEFTSESDTEAILKAYAKWGEDFADHLYGMFAIAIFDERRNRVVFARDRLGIKPLYFTRNDGRLRFASTLPALIAGGGVDTTLDPIGLHHYLSWHSIVPAPRTILRGAEKLPPATVRVVESDGRTRDRVYWSADYRRDASRSEWDTDDWIEALHMTLSAAVKRRLVSHVPVGVLLSGGLDSSLIVALLNELGVEGLQTFSIGFDSIGERQGDEFAYSDLIAKHFDTDHHRLHIPGDDLPSAVPHVIESMSEPMASHDVAAFYLLAEAVSEHVKVVQTGQGADELFAGYGYHQPLADASRLHALDLFTASFRDRSHDELREILEAEHVGETDVSMKLLEEQFADLATDTAVDAVLGLDTHTFMPDDPVKRVDNMTMAWGLEARVPFLDHELVELAAQCPPELKTMQGGKGLLKELGRRMLPHEVVDRPKGYFPVPGFTELRGEVLDMVGDVLTSRAARDRGVFRGSYVDELLSNPNGHNTPAGSNPLWSIAVLEMWLQRHLVGS